ncbi:UNVERIFIED_CONTAM: hypothetical protein PYX00_009875 [Menopon gallinae]|uniref:Uncharacterized protein n=1 Tax=Menopon gallinae TaxID=328185 RepID=A0AAW2HD01_9NEOP
MGVNFVRGSEAEEGRVFFGGKGIFAVGRRLRFAILPIMYKLGVISTMLVGITVMVLKGLTIGVILLFFALGNTFAKFKTHHIPQPVHFHLHSGHPGDIHHKVPVYSSYEPSGPWDKSLDEVDGTSHYENYDPSAPHRRIQPYRHSYTYPSRGYYGYYGR